MRAWRASTWLPAGIARVADCLLDFVVLAFAAWTAIYHLFLVVGAGVVEAAAATGVALVPSAWLAFRSTDTAFELAAEPEAAGRAASWPPRRAAVVLSVYSLAALGVAVAFAFSSSSWWLVWLLLATTAAVGVALAVARAGGRISLDPLGEAPSRPRRIAWLEPLVVLAWALGLALLSLFLVRPAADDAFYGRQASWIAEHGELPLRDVLFSDEVFPAIIYPPLSSIEALVGTAGHLTGLTVPTLLFFGLTPLASAFSVLAVWRLLRRFAVPLSAVALSLALLFLLLTAHGPRTFGNLFIGRIWEGKIAFVAILVPLLFVLLSEYADRPTRRALVLLVAAGAAGVGLTSSGAFLVPIVATGCLAPLLVRAPGRAALGLAAVTAYPLGSLLVRGLVEARRPATDTASDVAAGALVHVVPGRGWPAFVAVLAILVAPLLVRRASAGLMVSATVFLVVCLYAPPVPRLVWEATDIGKVLWRLHWAIPTAALVGVLATGVPGRLRFPALQAVPAVVLASVLVAGGTPLWSTVDLADEPAWKVHPGTLTPARRALREARPGDLILAPARVSRTILLLSGEVTTVAPRLFYALALEDVAGAHAEERALLRSFAERGLGVPVVGSTGETTQSDEVVRALEVLGVDLACIARNEEARRLLLGAGYSPVTRGRQIECLRAPPDRSTEDGGAG